MWTRSWRGRYQGFMLCIGPLIVLHVHMDHINGVRFVGLLWIRLLIVNFFESEPDQGGQIYRVLYIWLMFVIYCIRTSSTEHRYPICTMDLQVMGVKILRDVAHQASDGASFASETDQGGLTTSRCRSSPKATIPTRHRLCYISGCLTTRPATCRSSQLNVASGFVVFMCTRKTLLLPR